MLLGQQKKLLHYKKYQQDIARYPIFTIPRILSNSTAVRIRKHQMFKTNKAYTNSFNKFRISQKFSCPIFGSAITDLQTDFLVQYF
jgi:hypothetical protein